MDNSNLMQKLNDIVLRLKQHFNSVTVHPPADHAAFCELRERIPAVPEALLSFWGYCDGIRVTDCEGEIFGIRKVLDYYPLYDDTAGLGRFVPLRGDGCGDYDCLIVGVGQCEGSVVFWDHEIYDGAAYLLGGSFLNYLDMWAEHMVHEYLPDGEMDPRCQPTKLNKWPWLGSPKYQHPWPFDEAWVRERDPLADKLLSDESSRQWLLRQDDSTDA
jgi:hypothetical protein